MQFLADVSQNRVSKAEGTYNRCFRPGGIVHALATFEARVSESS